MVGEDADVEHVGIGEDGVGVTAGPGALVRGRVAVVGDGHEAGHVEGAKGAELVLGERFGGEHEQRRAGRIAEGRLCDRELVAERLP